MNPSTTRAALVWFRRDLRDFDHAALAAALRDHGRVFCAFVFDTDILGPLLARGLMADRRVDFIWRSLAELDAALHDNGGGLIVRHGRAVEEIPRLAAELGVAVVHANRDVEPLARLRDAEVARRLAADGRAFIDHKDQVIFERDEVLTQGGTPYAVFTPYARAWRARLTPADLAPHECTPLPGLLEAWQAGRTGYPLVDAAQRQLLQTGWMHNRLRMVSASFLSKDLGIDWRRGEAHFADWLLDFDLASNNGGWQWAASTGCDAQPWFRIFNPVTQSEKFDPQGRFIRRYVPELQDVPDKFIHAPWKMATPPADYPAPVVDHAVARERTLARFGAIRKV